MGRRPKAATTGQEASATGIEGATTPVTATPPARRPGRPRTLSGGTAAPVRSRRRTAVDHQAQGKILVDSLLKGRGTRGATQEETLAVVLWARGVHTEADELKALSTQVRKARAENAAERHVALGVNQALLAGVLAGTLIVDVATSGSVSFRKSD